MTRVRFQNRETISCSQRSVLGLSVAQTDKLALPIIVKPTELNVICFIELSKAYSAEKENILTRIVQFYKLVIN